MLVAHHWFLVVVGVVVIVAVVVVVVVAVVVVVVVVVVVAVVVVSGLVELRGKEIVPHRRFCWRYYLFLCPSPLIRNLLLSR